jgi:hypothetical protein
MQKDKKEVEQDVTERKNGETKERKKERKGQLAVRADKFLVEPEYANEDVP